MDRLDKIVEFVKEHGGVSYNLDELRVNVEGFIKNNSYVVLERDGELAAFCVWNMQGDVAQMEEVVIHPKYRKQGLLRYICVLGLEKFPHAKKLRFCRERKYEGREPHEIDIYKFIRR
jgi:hypothetical protein